MNRPVQTAKAIAVTLVVLLLTYLLGVWSASQNMFLFRLPSFVSRLPAALLQAPRYRYDPVNRLASDTQKSAVPCPVQNERTAVLLVAGQSNAGNHGGQRFRSEHGAYIVNFFDGQCFTAASPLLGSTGISGEYWTLAGNSLVSAGAFDRVVIAPVAVGGSSIAHWAHGGQLNAVLATVAVDLRDHGLRPTHVLWHQGESDVELGTSEAEYTKHFRSMADTLRTNGIAAPLFVSVASKCLPRYAPDNPIARAQTALPNPGQKIFAGVDSDALLGELDRFDDCHFSGSGQRKIAEAWAEIVAGSPAPKPPAPKSPAH